MPDHNNHGFSSNHRSNGSSHNNKTTKVDPKDAKIDSLNKIVNDLQIQSVELKANVGVLTTDTANLHKQLVQQSIKYQRDVKSLNEQLTSLNQQLTTAKENQSMFTVFATPYGCSILIVLILALTMIALKKGFSVSKGDTNISVGDKK